MPTSKVYVSAFMCKDAIRDAIDTNSVSAIRIFDTFTVCAEDVALAKDLKVLSGAFLVTSYRSENPTEFTAEYRASSPSGKVLSIQTLTVRIAGGETGHTHVLSFDLAPARMSEGVHWFDILIDGEVVTRVPVKVVHAPGIPPSQKNEIQIGPDAA
jgi:hypothetical protein